MIEASAASFELACTKLQYPNSNLNVCKPEENLQVQPSTASKFNAVLVSLGTRAGEYETTKQVAIVTS